MLFLNIRAGKKSRRTGGQDLSSTYFCISVVDHHNVTLNHTAAERNGITFAPDLGTDSFTRINRRREPEPDPMETCRIVVTKGFQNGVRGYTKCAQAMQDRSLEPSSSGNSRRRMQRVIVTLQAIDK